MFARCWNLVNFFFSQTIEVNFVPDEESDIDEVDDDFCFDDVNV